MKLGGKRVSFLLQFRFFGGQGRFAFRGGVQLGLQFLLRRFGLLLIIGVFGGLRVQLALQGVPGGDCVSSLPHQHGDYHGCRQQNDAHENGYGFLHKRCTSFPFSNGDYFNAFDAKRKNPPCLEKKTPVFQCTHIDRP